MFLFPRCILLIVVMSCFCGAHLCRQLLWFRFCVRSRLWWSRNGRRWGAGDGSKHLRSSGGSTKMEWVGMERIRRKKLRNISPSASNDVHLPALWLESNPSHDWDCFLDQSRSFHEKTYFSSNHSFVLFCQHFYHFWSWFIAKIAGELYHPVSIMTE